MDRARLKNLINDKTCELCTHLTPEAQQHCNYFAVSLKENTCDHWGENSMMANRKMALDFVFGEEK